MLPVPPPLIPGAGPRPVLSSDDVAKHLPDALKRPEIDDVREALVAALTGLLQEWQFRSDRAVALMDPLRSVEQYLSALGADRGVGKAKDEDEESFRDRMARRRLSVTEKALAAGINAILSLFTDAECQLVDAVLDQWFINDGTDGHGGPAKWHSFVGSGPHYPDRLLSDDAVNNAGFSRPNSAVGGARVFKDGIGRHLLIRVPDLGFQQRDASFVWDGGSVGNNLAATAPGGLFVGDGSAPPAGGYIDAANADPAAVYAAIGNFVNLSLGQSIRWTMLTLGQ